MKKILAIIPVYNEEFTIGNVVKSINLIKVKNNLKIDILVINDGSTDKSSLIASSLGCNVINFVKNKGKSYALHEGILFALKNHYDYVLEIDGDGQHPVHQIPRLIKYLERKKLDVVVGSRFIKKIGYQSSFGRRIGITYFNLLLRLITSQKITDSTSGFKLVNRRTMIIISDLCKYQDTEAIMLLHYINHHLRFEEISVAMKQRRRGKSSFNLIFSIIYMIKVSLELFYYSLINNNYKKQFHNV